MSIAGSLDEIDLSALQPRRDFDLAIIGSGPAGQKAAISAAKKGARVAIIERDPLAGGACLNTGTIPSKTLREAVVYLTGYRQRGYYGEDYRLKEKVSAGDLIRRTNHVLRLERGDINDHLVNNGVSRLVGVATLAGPNEIDVTLAGTATRLTADKIIIAVGTRPRRPAEVPFDGRNVFDSDAVFGSENDLRPLPDSIIILGAGVIGIEYASMFAALDVPTTLVDPRPNPLSFVDEEIAGLLYEHLRSLRVKLIFGANYQSIKLSGDAGHGVARIHVELDTHDPIEADELLFALGRIPATDALNLPAAGVEVDRRGNIIVDKYYRTSVPSIYAAGDVIGFPSLASTSAEQGRVAALHALGVSLEWDPELLPYGIYTIPEISMVGRTEQQLKADGTPYYIGTGLWRDTARGKILGDMTGALKLIFNAETDRLVGVHLIGDGATELLHIGQAVMHFGGGADYFMSTVFNYPTLAETYKVAAYNAINRRSGKATHNEPLMQRVWGDMRPAEYLKWSVG